MSRATPKSSAPKASATKASAPAFKVNGANHVGFTVANITRSLLFWKGVLNLPVGLPEVSSAIAGASMGQQISQLLGVPNTTLHVATVSLPGKDGMQIELLQYELPKGQEAKAYDLSTASPGSAHVGLSVTGIDAIVKKAEDIGWRNMGKKQNFLYMANVAYLRGPDGETVELMELGLTFS